MTQDTPSGTPRTDNCPEEDLFSLARVLERELRTTREQLAAALAAVRDARPLIEATGPYSSQGWRKKYALIIALANEQARAEGEGK